MKLPDIQSNIIRWVSTCETWAHFDAIEMAVNNCLMNRKAEFGVDAVEEAEHEIGRAVIARFKVLQLQPVEAVTTGSVADSAFEEVYGDTVLADQERELKKINDHFENQNDRN